MKKTLKTEDFLHQAQELEYQKWMQEKGFDLEEVSVGRISRHLGGHAK